LGAEFEAYYLGRCDRFAMLIYDIIISFFNRDNVMPPKLDLRNKVFTRLTVIKETELRNAEGHVMWDCRCECGNMVNVSAAYLKKGNNRSCGCLQREAAARNGTRTHEMSGTSIYDIWCSMLKRCNNPNNKNYGGRGIKVCDRWLDFKNFYEDMGERKGKLTIDRIDNNGNYEPSNCKWSSIKEQANNRRGNIMLTYENECLTLAQWSEKTGINRMTIYWRNKQGWATEKILGLVV
jgi:hypothetical protein